MPSRFYMSKDRKGDHNYPWLIVLVNTTLTSYYCRTRTGEDALDVIRKSLDYQFFLGYPI